MVVATVASREKVNTLLHALMDAGLQVGSLDVAPTALRRIVSALYTGHAADNVLMINTYRDDSYLTVISGRRLLFSQSSTSAKASCSIVSVAKWMSVAIRHCGW